MGPLAAPQAAVAPGKRRWPQPNVLYVGLMKPLKVAREQQIAVFGESGSGKTVLLSSFYGAAQEPAFIEKSLYKITADTPAQGLRLHQNYLGMKNAGSTPAADRFSATKYVFSVKQRPNPASKGKKPAAG